VFIEVRPEESEHCREFYTQILGLLLESSEPPAHDPASPQAEGELRLVGQHHRLVLQFRRNPEIDSVKRAALITVKSLTDVREMLEDRAIPYVRLRSLGWAGERVQVSDPSGNLLELRQERLV
jgi:catechol 2,3-dioxygenase-like lactoylglutathione lyase family enzyme